MLTFLLIVASSLAVFAKEAENVNIYAVPREAPENQFYTETGTPVTLSDFKGKFILLMHWSRDCGPCIRELDNLNEFYKKTKDTGIALIMLSSDREWSDNAEQRKFLNKYDAEDLPFYVDKDGKLAEALGIFTSPHTALFNSKGQEIGRIRGAAEWDDPRVIEYIYKLKSKYN